MSILNRVWFRRNSAADAPALAGALSPKYSYLRLEVGPDGVVPMMSPETIISTRLLS